ncbi:hypothetical protein BASA83_000296 [Batrachochytrium salamandrivorans]|nr:hypothetical protein BASA83_000296 [Batrachochytrium salamandrivorans]
MSDTTSFSLMCHGPDHERCKHTEHSPFAQPLELLVAVKEPAIQYRPFAHLALLYQGTTSSIILKHRPSIIVLVALLLLWVLVSVIPPQCWDASTDYPSSHARLDLLFGQESSTDKARLVATSNKATPTGLFPILQGIQNMCNIGSIELHVTGGVKTTLEIQSMGAVDYPDLADVPPSISLAYLIESSQKSLAQLCNITTIIHANGTSVYIQTPHSTALTEQMVLVARLGLPNYLVGDDVLHLSTSLSNGIVNISPINSTLALGRLRINVDVGTINANGVTAESINMRTGAGAINLVANVTRDLYVEANTGYIQISAAFVEPLLPHTSQLARTAEIVSNGGWVRGSVSSYLELDVKSQAGPITLALNPQENSKTVTMNNAGVTNLNFAHEFHGRFIAQTSLGRAYVTGKDIHMDPTHFPFPGTLKGYVRDSSSRSGFVHASASVGVVSLDFA